MDNSELKSILLDLQSRILEIRNGIFDVTSKEKRLEDISNKLSQEKVWSDLDLSQKLSKEKSSIEKSLTFFQSTEMQIGDNLTLLEMAIDEADLETIKEIEIEIKMLKKNVEDLEFSRMFTNKMDPIWFRWNRSSRLG
jgi:peptide chain release factor 2